MIFSISMSALIRVSCQPFGFNNESMFFAISDLFPPPFTISGVEIENAIKLSTNSDKSD